jgi:hypothetical protein
MMPMGGVAANLPKQNKVVILQVGLLSYDAYGRRKRMRGAWNIVAPKTLPKPEQGSNIPTGSNNL